MREEPEIVKILRQEEQNDLLLISDEKRVEPDNTDFEDDLDEIKERYRSLFEGSMDWVYISDFKGNFLDANPAALKGMGYTKEELKKLNFANILKKGQLIKALKETHKLKKTGIQEDVIEYKVQRKDGSIAYLETMAAPLYKNGKPYAVQGIARDITKRKQNELKIKRITSAIEQSPISVIITDDKGVIEYINPRYSEISGYNNDELIGKHTRVLKSGMQSEEFYENLWSTISSGEIWKGEMQNKKKNGELYWENVFITPIKDSKGHISSYVSSKVDITKQKQIQEEMKVKEYAMRSSINAIAIANSVGNISYVNPSFLKMWGYYNDKEIIGKPIVKFWQMKGQYMKVMDAMVNEGGWVGELSAERSDGTTFPVQLSANLVKDENGEMKYMMASFVDITKQKQAEEELLKNQKRIEAQNIQLKKLDELKSTFLNVTSHELRTPMASIKGYIQMIMKRTLGDTSDEQNKALNVVLRNIERLDHLIQDILDISRLESGTMKFIPENTDISKMMEEIAETMKSSAETKQIKIKTEIKTEIPKLFIDQDRVKQVIINFINNAIKFSEPETSITIKASKKNENILFEIEDQGRGIPKDKLDRVFDTFYQVDSGMDRKFGGAGLGLAISRGIVLSHGGEIWVESKEGEGSTFKFTLPIEGVKDIEGKFKEVDVFRLKDDKVKKGYEKYKDRMKI